MSKAAHAAENGSLQRYPARSLRLRIRFVPKGRRAAPALGARDGAAQWFGVDCDTIRRRAVGKHEMPRPAARPLRSMLIAGFTAEQVVSLLRAERGRSSAAPSIASNLDPED